MKKIFFFSSLLLFFASAFIGGWAMAEQPYPPLVPEGETFANLPELVQNISIQSAINCIAFSPDGKIIASGSSDHNVRLWEVSTGKVLNTLTGHIGPVYSVCFSPDGIGARPIFHKNRIWHFR